MFSEGVPIPLIIGFVILIGGWHSEICGIGERNVLLSDKTMLIDT